MKNYQKLKFNMTLISCLVILMTSCNSVKYSTEFKNNKKSLKELTVFEPFVNIVEIRHDKKIIDTNLVNANIAIIDSVTIDLLSSKYKIEKKQLPQIRPELYNEIYNQLDIPTEEFKEISCDTLLSILSNSYQTKYALLITCNLEIDWDKLYLVSGPVIPVEHPTFTSNLRLIVFDTENKKVVYYDRIISPVYDPRIRKTGEYLTKRLLKSIYYK